ncbi:hypothetical protein LOK49_LG03G03909 [Camellia lanceoleosa]|uniref:Uncharacterized protein n=1 Tax=Camellia lanceoleosa TaxID=1840588 RepID=A0ACC0IB24_9ERIC|nr:hypothetical protein LOK49_LG03G03909 [Camellia lanceoleosa]
MKGGVVEGTGRVCEEFSAGYYGLCTVGGMFGAGTSHLATTPFDVLKVNMQVNPVKYHGISSGLSTLWKEQGPSALWRGWSGKFFGYGVQGGCKFGLYEYFKKLYSNVLVDHNKSVIFFASSASAQVFADVALCPFEAVKVRVQTQPNFIRACLMGFQNYMHLKGFLVSMIMFSTFEHRFYISQCYPKKKGRLLESPATWCDMFSRLCSWAIGTIISNPADNVVSSLQKKADTVLQAVKNIGFVNLFTRSLPIRITLVGPVVTMQWFFYDTIKSSKWIVSAPP